MRGIDQILSPPPCPAWCTADHSNGGWITDGLDVTKTCQRRIVADTPDATVTYWLERFASIDGHEVRCEPPTIRWQCDTDRLSIPTALHLADVLVRVGDLVGEATAAA